MGYFDRLTFTKDWTRAADFPTYEPDETQVRADLQQLHNEAKAALNALMDKLEANTYAANLPVSSTQFSATNLKAALEEIIAVAQAAQAGTLVDGSVPEAKLTAAVQAKLNSCGVVYAMNPPAGENPATGNPLGQLWLRPAFTITNRVPDWSFATGADWTAVYGTKSVSGGALTLAGSSASRYGQATCTLTAPAGHAVRVWLKATAVAGQAASLTLNVNGVQSAMTSGSLLAVNTTAAADGTVAISVTADWSNTQTAAGSSIRLDAFAAVDTAALMLTGADALTTANLDALVAAALPFGTSAQPRAVYGQELSGVWTQLIYDALPVERGGTGKKTLAQNALLAGNGTGAVAELPVSNADGKILAQNADGTFGWVNPFYSQIVSYMGTGSYGAGNPCSVTFKTAPKYAWFVMGLSAERNYCPSDGNICHAVFFDCASLTAEYADVMSYTSNQGYTRKIRAKLNGGTLSWYFTTTDTSVTTYEALYAQENYSGVKYYWAAIF